MTAQTQQHSTWLAFTDSALTVEDLWLYYFGVGGDLEVFELGAYLHGMYELSQYERNAVAVALNEMIDDLPQSRRAEFVHPPRL